MAPPANTPQSASARDPFAATPDVAGYVPRADFERAQHAIVESLRADEAMIVLCGPPGLGKTFMLHVLADRLAGEFRPLSVPFPSLPAEGLFRWILEAQGVPSGPAGSDVRAAVSAAVRSFDEQGRKLLLLVDDAASMPTSTAVALRELYADLSPSLRAVLVAGDDPASGAVLDALGAELRVVRLGAPLTEAETGEYVRRRITRARLGGAVLARFDDATIARIHGHAEGVPARVNELADLLLRPEETARSHELARELRPEAVLGALATRQTERVVDWADDDLARLVGSRGRRRSARPTGRSDRPDDEVLLVDEVAPGAVPSGEPVVVLNQRVTAAPRAARPPTLPRVRESGRGRTPIVFAAAATLVAAVAGWLLLGPEGAPVPTDVRFLEPPSVAAAPPAPQAVAAKAAGAERSAESAPAAASVPPPVVVVDIDRPQAPAAAPTQAAIADRSAGQGASAVASGTGTPVATGRVVSLPTPTLAVEPEPRRGADEGATARDEATRALSAVSEPSPKEPPRRPAPRPPAIVARAGASPPPELLIDPTNASVPAASSRARPPVVPGVVQPESVGTVAGGGAAESPATPGGEAAADVPVSALLPAVSATAASAEPVALAVPIVVRVRASSGAEIIIDDEPRGRAPLFGVALTPGPHRVEVRYGDGTVRTLDAVVDAADPVIDVR